MHYPELFVVQSEGQVRVRGFFIRGEAVCWEKDDFELSWPYIPMAVTTQVLWKEKGIFFMVHVFYGLGSLPQINCDP